MKKLLKSIWIIIFLLVSGGNLFAQDDFVGGSPNTDKFDKLCYPVKAGNSVKIPITVKCYMTKQFQPYTVSIDTSASFSGYYGWVKIENNSQRVDPSKIPLTGISITK